MGAEERNYKYYPAVMMPNIRQGDTAGRPEVRRLPECLGKLTTTTVMARAMQDGRSRLMRMQLPQGQSN